MKKTREQRQQEFLKALSFLTRRYKLQIGGCGCCGSPWLYDDPKITGGHYECQEDGNRLFFLGKKTD